MSDNRLTAMMIDDCLHDPVLGAKVLLGYRHIPPHLELRLWAHWTMPFYIDHSGYGTAKSLSIAMVFALRCMLMEGRTEGLLSYTFDQGKLVFNYFDEWAQKNAIFRSQVVKDRNGHTAITHGASAWEIRFKSDSRIRCIPPDFHRESERAGSEDWTDAAFDEVSKYPNLDTFTRQFVTRVRKPVPECYDTDDPIYGRHIFFGGTARAITHPFYKPYVQRYQELIKSGSNKHEILSFNYRHIDEKYHRLLNIDAIHELEATLPRDRVEQEVMGRWTQDATTWYSPTDIEMARRTPSPVLTEYEE